MSEKEELNVLRSLHMFTRNICNILKKRENVFLSPTSAHLLLSMAYQASKGSSNDPFCSTLAIQDAKAAADGYKEIIPKLNSLKNVNFSIDNKLYIMDGYTLQQNFNTTMRESFYSILEPSNFGQTDVSNKNINAWIEEKTRSKIKYVTSSENVTDLTRVVFVNTVYFKSDWETKFSADLINDEPFYINEYDFVEVPMMHVTKNFKFKEDTVLNAKVLEVPLKNEDIALLVILPNDRNGIVDLEEKLANLGLTFVAEGMADTEVEVTLPKLIIEESNDLSDILSEMGLCKEFNHSEANFTGMISAEEQLYVGKILQNTFIDINEDGVEAATATVSYNLSEDKESMNKLPSNSAIDVFELQIKSKVCNRFAKTIITNKVENHSATPQESIFSVVLPEKAFITEFVMEIDGKIYKAYIKEKEEAKNIYTAAVSTGRAAAQVAMTSRDSNNFDVSVNIQPKSKATFILTYEELLQRQAGHYEIVLNIKPGQIVQNLIVEVHISESKPLISVITPQLRTGNEAIQDNEFLNPNAEIEHVNDSYVIVKFSPSVHKQKMYSRHMGNSVNNGFAGQFVVYYDVQRDNQGGEILLNDGYFVHFFAPDNLAPLPKHIVFVLDVSGSMMGIKIKQLIDAMNSIFPQLEGDNFFSVIEFHSIITVWDLDNYSKTAYNGQVNHLFSSFRTNMENIEKARNMVNTLSANGGTDIYTALKAALEMLFSEQKTKIKYQPLIIFLTDGEPTVGIRDTEKIINQITLSNNEQVKTPIFTLSFGDGADKRFLRKLSLKNYGFSRHIYEAADASMQLQDFFRIISSPQLCNVTFKYDSEVSRLTNCHFPLHFFGSELIVCGVYQKHPVSCTVNGQGCLNPICYKPNSANASTSLERLWAYLSVKQILDQSETAGNKGDYLKQALEIALKYSFVTQVTSLVVVKPESSECVEPKRDGQSLSFGPQYIPQSFGFGDPSPKFLCSASLSQRDPTFGAFTNHCRSLKATDLFGAAKGSFEFQRQTAQTLQAPTSLFGSPRAQTLSDFCALDSPQDQVVAPASNSFGQLFGATAASFTTSQQPMFSGIEALPAGWSLYLPGKLLDEQVQNINEGVADAFSQKVPCNLKKRKDTTKFSASHRFMVLLKIQRGGNIFVRNCMFTFISTKNM